jgi:TetR/AcrR family transcriptional repressor of nem operon
MSRPRTFDEEQVLDRAMHLLWERGYAQTSMDDLVKHTGIHRGTLYALYNDKRGLLLAALDRYIEQVLRPLTAELRANMDGWQALQRTLTGLAAELKSEKLPACCLTIHCAVEAATTDAEIAARVRHGVDLLDDALESAIRRAQLAGQIPKKKDARNLAALLRCTIQGLQVFARTTPRHPAIAAIPQVLFGMLHAPES